MTKLGTPIGAGPKGAIVVVGLALRRGAAVAELRAAVGPSSGGWIAGGRAGGADRRRRSVAAGVAEALVAVRRRRRRSSRRPRRRRGRRRSGRRRLRLRRPSALRSRRRRRLRLLADASEADSQSGSSRSASPSPSSSASFAQAGGCAEGKAGVVAMPSAALARAEAGRAGRRPAMPTPSAVTTAKPARAMISASLCLIRWRLYTRVHGIVAARRPPSPHASGTPTLLARAGVAQRVAAAPNKALINVDLMPVRTAEDFSATRMRSLS